MKRFAALWSMVLLLSVSVFGQTAVKKTALLWDASYGMIDKDLDKEFAFLDSYFNRNPEVSVQLTVFSNTVLQEETFQIRQGDWARLKQELSNTIYDGSSSFEGIFPTDVDEVVLVTDGRLTSGSIPSLFSKPVYIISSLSEANSKDLSALAIGSGGAYINIVSSPQAIASAKGESSVDDSGLPAREQVIRNARRDGSSLRNDKEMLGEVLISTSREEEEIVNTGNLKQDRRKLGYAIESITADDIQEQDITLENAIQGQFTNVFIKGDQNLSEFVSRGRNMTILLNQTGLIVIDGIPVESSVEALTGINAPTNGPGTNIDKTILTNVSALDPDNVENITVLKGLAATNKYGTLGRNGVILITTKAATVAGSTNTNKPKALGTTATYTGDANTTSALPNTPYIRALQKADDINQAYEIYLNQRKIHGDKASYYLDVASYFKDWNNPFTTNRILSNISELPNASVADQLALGYKYQELGLEAQAVAVFEKLLEKAPKDIQHYRNLALAYQQAGQYQDALVLYDRMDKGHFEDILGNTGLSKTIATEFKNLVALRRGSLNTSYINPQYKNNVQYTKRVVFEWNHYDAEFDLQIVNPQQRFFTWSHTQENDPLRLANDLEEGHGLEEFFMTASDRGEWLFNASYVGKKIGNMKDPVYLKITTYSNYGKPNQTQEVKVVTLKGKEKQTVLKVSI